LIWLKLDAGWDDAEDPVVVEGRAAAGGLLPGKACVLCADNLALLACNVIATAFMLIVT
jgi:hypothetical protein